jgi:hypothetical protein
VTAAEVARALDAPLDVVAVPAVRNAILDATGATLNALPLTPERVWIALADSARRRSSKGRPLPRPVGARRDVIVVQSL